MSNINETQRKYIRQRLTELKQLKQNEINNTYNTGRGTYKTQEEIQERIAHIKAVIAKAKLPWTIDQYGGITTEWDIAWDDKRVLFDETRVTKQKQLNELFNELMDKVILGSDSEELAAVLAALNDFKTN